MDWWHWRLILHPELGATLTDLNRVWSFAEVFEAHLALDAMEQVTEYRRAQAKKRRGR